MMPTPGETAGACAYYGDGEARWLAYIEIGCRFTEEAACAQTTVTVRLVLARAVACRA